MSESPPNPSEPPLFSHPSDATELPRPVDFVPLPPCASCGADVCAHERMYEPPPGLPVPRVAVEAIADGRTYSCGEEA